MIARRNVMPEMLRRGSHEPLRRKQWYRGDPFIRASRKQIDRKPQAREMDFFPSATRLPGGEFVALVEILDGLEIVFPGTSMVQFAHRKLVRGGHLGEPAGANVCSDRRMSSASTMLVSQNFARSRRSRGH